MTVNYKGSITAKLFTAIEKHPEMSMSEIFQSFLGKKALGKHFFEASDQEIYTALEKLCEEVDDKDEPFDEAGWSFWVQKVIVK